MEGHARIPSSVLAVDLGKTGCRAALWTSEGRTEAEGAGAPGLAAPAGVAGAEAAIAAICRPLLNNAGLAQVEAAAIGAAGALASPEAARHLARRLCVLLPAAETAVTSDAVTSHAGALGGGPGVVLAAGTGAVALGVGRDGALHRADGWGPWLGDEGGGAWLGLRGLRAALRAVDGRGPATALQAAAEARFGTLAGLSGLIEGSENPPRLAAAFAPDIAAAAGAGDAVAAALMCRAVEALAATAAAAARSLSDPPPIPLAITGGLLRLGPTLAGPLERALRASSPLLVLVAATGTALDGARLLATRRDTVHERAVMRAAAGNRTGRSPEQRFEREA